MRFKLYKSGKFWIAATAASVAIITGGVQVLADDTSSSMGSTEQSSSSNVDSSATGQSVTLTSTANTDVNEQKNGWVTESGAKYYYKDNVKATGQQDIDGKFYLFNKDTGAMETGFQSMQSYGQDKVCYFDPTTGIMAHGDTVVDGVTYQIDQYTGALQSGWTSSNAGKVYVNSDGSLVKGQKYIDGGWRLFDNNGVMQTGFQDLSAYGTNKTMYFDQDGKAVYGQQYINGQYYVFSHNEGALLTGFQDLKSYGQDKVVYLDPNNGGAMVHDSIIVDGITYHFDTNGGWHNGGLISGWQTKDGEKYYIQNNGAVSKGQQYINGKWYFFDDNGVMQTGFVNLSSIGVNKTMYYDKDGVALYGQQYINGQYYVFSHNEGALLTGFQDLKSYGQDKVVYLDPNNGGAMVHDSITVDGVTYHFDTNGGWHNGGLVSGWQTENGKKYYVQSNGVASKGQQHIDGKWYFFDDSGVMQTGFVNLESIGVNKTMYYDKDGVALYGQQYIDGQYYVFSHNEGALLTGFQSLKDYGQDKLVYLDPNNGGAMVHDSVVVDGVTYNFYNGDGWTNGKLLTGWSTSTNGKVYVNADGSLKSGELKDDAYWYYFDPTTHTMQTGFISLSDGRKVYYSDQGRMLYGQQEIDGAHYSFDGQNGDMQTGFLRISVNGQKQTVYYDPTTGQQVFGDQVINGFNYHFNETTGALESTDARGWQTIDGQHYYYDDQGMPTIGETHIGNYFYYFDNNGVMQTNAFVNLGSKIGYYNSYGEMVYGQQYISGKYYLFERYSGAMQTGFQDLHSYGESKTVYYENDGSMVHGDRTINGVTYRFDNNTGALYFTPTYYSQKDGRWGNIYFGGYSMASSACVMASIAMVSTGYGNTVTPLDTAWYGHTYSGFDKYGSGADQATLKDVANHYGMSVNGLHSASDIQNSLENGRPVLIAVQAPFIPWSWGSGVTHEIVLSQYSNGNVYVSDPLGTTSGWHNINDVWNNRSMEGGDSDVFGTPAVQLVK